MTEEDERSGGSKSRAVIVRLEEREDGLVRVAIDDLVQSSSDSRNWVEDVPVTHKDYKVDTLEKMSFEDEELAQFGAAIMARLYAFRCCGKL